MACPATKSFHTMHFTTKRQSKSIISAPPNYLIISSAHASADYIAHCRWAAKPRVGRIDDGGSASLPGRSALACSSLLPRRCGASDRSAGRTGIGCFYQLKTPETCCALCSKRAEAGHCRLSPWLSGKTCLRYRIPLLGVYSKV